MSIKITRVRPQPGPQFDFLSTTADIAIYGGSAGGGKTYALLLECGRNQYNPEFGAVIFRRTSPQITNEGALWDTSEAVYPGMEAVPNLSTLRWRFPSGATVRFAHLQYEDNIFDWQGSQVPLICFDELTHFTEKQFSYIVFSRGRTTCGVVPYVRATCNPDPDSWVRQFIAWWIDDKTGLAIPERSGVIRWMIRRNDTWVWFDTQQDAIDYLRERGDMETMPKSVTFVRSSVYDNKILLETNPEYLSNLNSLGSVERAQLKDGNWNVRNANGIFKQADLDRHRVKEHPVLALVAVGVDPPAKSKDSSDMAGIVVVGRDDQDPPHYYVLEDLSLRQATPAKWGAQAVTAYAKHRADMIAAESNNGGDMVESTIQNVDKRVVVTQVTATRGKRLRAQPYAVMLAQGRLHMVGAYPELERQMCNWNEEEAESPDRMDAMVWAIKWLDGTYASSGGPVDPRFIQAGRMGGLV